MADDRAGLMENATHQNQRIRSAWPDSEPRPDAVKPARSTVARGAVEVAEFGVVHGALQERGSTVQNRSTSCNHNISPGTGCVRPKARTDRGLRHGQSQMGAPADVARHCQRRDFCRVRPRLHHHTTGGIRTCLSQSECSPCSWPEAPLVWPVPDLRGRLLLVALNARYRIDGATPSIAFFIGIYDVLHNLGVTDAGATAALATCPDNQC
jgi:hypothetical protein